MSLSVSKIQAEPTITEVNTSFKAAKVANGAKLAEKTGKKLNDAIGVVGWLMIIGLLIGGWASGCSSLINKKADNAVETPAKQNDSVAAVLNIHA